MKVVVDCNIIISAGLKDGLCRTILNYVLDNCDIYVSEDTLKEYIAVSQRAKFSSNYDLLEKIIILFRRSARLVKVKELNIKLPDPSDTKYINLAIAVHAKYIITGNIKDFPDLFYKNTRVVSPREFFDKYIGN